MEDWIDSETKALAQIIASAARQRAEERGFMPGYEMQDWLHAQAEVMAQMYGRDRPAA
ncbi:hypothetical protein SBBP2_1250006 [Burkholderiales bacterium]|jgi:hypothetical protein|nr:hypothetical protein SBBP2_1250006 [Burkholderiales bacterium]